MPKAGPDKQLCGAQRPNQPKGVTCTQRAGWGTDHTGTGRCKRHGGLTPSHEKHAQELQARELCQSLGRPIQTTAAEALLGEIYEAAGNVEYYRAQVQDLDAIYGPTFHQSGVPTGEAKPHVLVVLYNDERKHLAKITVDALKVGIAAAMVQIAEQQATQLAAALRGFAVALGHDPADPKVREAFRAQLTVLRGGLAA